MADDDGGQGGDRQVGQGQRDGEGDRPGQPEPDAQADQRRQQRAGDGLAAMVMPHRSSRRIATPSLR